jgi:hypothetical protein
MLEDLENWIQPHHLKAAELEHISAELLETPEKTTVLDGFLAPEQFETLTELFYGDGAFEQKYKRKGYRLHVSAAEFEAVGSDNQFLTHLQLEGPATGMEMRRSVLRDLLFRRFLGGPAKRFFSACVKAPIDAVENINAKILGVEHFLKPHSDAVVGRKLCCVLYMSTDWTPSLGGRFELHLDGEIIRTIEPIANRLIIFQPGTRYLHAVEQFTEAGRDWRRCNYSFWYR